MKVRVKQGKTGFYGGNLRVIREELEVLDESHVGLWMDRMEEPKATKVDEPKAPKVDYKAEAERLGIPVEVDGNKVHHLTLKKQVETALAQEQGE
jgi:hypothetical protein